MSTIPIRPWWSTGEAVELAMLAVRRYPDDVGALGELWQLSFEASAILMLPDARNLIRYARARLQRRVA